MEILIGLAFGGVIAIWTVFWINKLKKLDNSND